MALPLSKLPFVFVALFSSSFNSLSAGDKPPSPEFSTGSYSDQIGRMQAFKSSLIRRQLASSPSPASSPEVGTSGRTYKVTTYGADPSGKLDSTNALLKAIFAAFDDVNNGFILMDGINNLGGAHINLEGGIYAISKPLRFPTAGAGNLMISGGTLRASNDFPTDGYLIDLSVANTSSASGYNNEFVTLRDLMLDCNYKGGGIFVASSLRTSIDNCYVAHFTTNGIFVQGGHETYIRNSFLGQHITAGADHGERNFSGTAINLVGNDNAVTDVVIFSAGIGVMVSGQGNTLSGVHCYNKATGFGGTGIYVKLPGLTQTRIINCYLDYNGIVAEDPVQLSITNSFFLGDGHVVLKSINGVANGVTIADNMFAGSNKGVDIVQLDGNFKEIEQVFVERNIVKGMNKRSTVASDYVQGNGTIWTVDFSRSLLFPNMINHVQYSFLSSISDLFPNHALRNVSDNRVVIQSDMAVSGRVFVSVSQGLTG